MAFASASAPQRERRGLWDQLVDCICRPPRDCYSLNELIGGTRGKFTIDQRRFRREDLVLTNRHGQKLQCSHYKSRGPADKRPCVIYAHCNSGSRRDAEEALYVLLPHNITVFCLDFAGSGLSDGDWVTLGAHEVDDVAAAVDHLRDAGQTSTIGLWGRSMGAVTAMAYARQDPSICGIVVDSPFSRLTDLMTELVVEQKLPIPRPFMRVALSMMRRSVRKRAHFSIDDVAPLDYVGETFVPVLFGHATEDTFVGKHHSERLVAAYAGDKNFITFRGDHNSVRPNFFYASVLIFFHNVLQCPDELPEVPTPRHARASARDRLSRQSLGITDSDASSLSISFTAPSAASAASPTAEAGEPSPSAASVSSGSSPLAHPQREADIGGVLDPVIAARANSFRRGSLASESATSDGGSSVHSLGMSGAGGRAFPPAPPLPAPALDSTNSRRSRGRSSPGSDADDPILAATTFAPADCDEDAELQLALEASLQQLHPQPAPPTSPPPAGRPPQQPQSPEQLADIVLQRLPAQTGAGPPPEAVSADLGISVEEVEASMVAAAIRLSLQESGSSNPSAQPKIVGPTGPASLKMVAAAAHCQRSRSSGGTPPHPRPRVPFRSKSAGTASPLGRTNSPAADATRDGNSSPAAPPNGGPVAAAQELPPIVGHVTGSLRVSPSPAGGSPSSIGSGGDAQQDSPFAPTFAAPQPAADNAAGTLPVKALADARQGSRDGGGGGSQLGQPGGHVGLAHVELGPTGGRLHDAFPSVTDEWTAGGATAAEAAGSGNGSSHARPAPHDISLDGAIGNATRWAAGHKQQQQQQQHLAQASSSSFAGSIGSNRSSDDGSSQTAAPESPPQQRRPWWGGDRSASMRRMPSDSAAPSAGSGHLGISRSERPAAEKAGLQRSVFGSADGLTFYTALGAPDANGQRRTGSDGGGDGTPEPQQGALWQPAARNGGRQPETDTTAPILASPAGSCGSGSGASSGRHSGSIGANTQPQEHLARPAGRAGEAPSPQRPLRPKTTFRRIRP